jgi:hypothetical protein
VADGNDTPKADPTLRKGFGSVDPSAECVVDRLSLTVESA